MNPLAIIEEINKNYKTTFIPHWCPKCSHMTAHLLASTFTPTGEMVTRQECTVCHKGETNLISK